MACMTSLHALFSCMTLLSCMTLISCMTWLLQLCVVTAVRLTCAIFPTIAVTAFVGCRGGTCVPTTMIQIGDLVQVPWARRLWCASVTSANTDGGCIDVDWHGFPHWKQNRVKVEGVRVPLPPGASCVGKHPCCPSHHLTEHWAYCIQAPGCTCKKCRKEVHDDECFVCGKHGKVMMCDGEDCNKVAHYKCVGLREVAIGDWLCSDCCTPPETLPWKQDSKPNVISLFDGIAIGRQALWQLGFHELGGYHAFELSPHAMGVANTNHKDITQHGDVREVSVHIVCSCLC